MWKLTGIQRWPIARKAVVGVTNLVAAATLLVPSGGCVGQVPGAPRPLLGGFDRLRMRLQMVPGQLRGSWEKTPHREAAELPPAGTNAVPATTGRSQVPSTADIFDPPARTP